ARTWGSAGSRWRPLRPGPPSPGGGRPRAAARSGWSWCRSGRWPGRPPAPGGPGGPAAWRSRIRRTGPPPRSRRTWHPSSHRVGRDTRPHERRYGGRGEATSPEGTISTGAAVVSSDHARSSNQVVLVGERGGGRPRGDPELGEDVLEVPGHGVLAQHELA